MVQWSFIASLFFLDTQVREHIIFLTFVAKFYNTDIWLNFNFPDRIGDLEYHVRFLEYKGEISCKSAQKEFSQPIWQIRISGVSLEYK